MREKTQSLAELCTKGTCRGGRLKPNVRCHNPTNNGVITQHPQNKLNKGLRMLHHVVWLIDNSHVIIKYFVHISIKFVFLLSVNEVICHFVLIHYFIYLGRPLPRRAAY